MHLRYPPSMTTTAQAWYCTVCGYMHYGPEPPSECPICGVGPELFEPREVEAPAAGTSDVADDVSIAIIGAGIAGISAAEGARRQAPRARIRLFESEPDLPYQRINLSRYLSGEVSRENLLIQRATWFEEHRIDFRRGAAVVRIEPDRGRVLLADGTSEPFDRLVLATGAEVFVPPVPGLDGPGIIRMRTLADHDRALEAARRGVRCLCVGGGILGLEAAAGLARQGAKVTVVEASPWLMPRQLDRAAAGLLAAQLAALGIDLMTGAKIESVEETAGGHAMTVSGRRLEADTIVVATGIRPRVDLARAAGINVKRGIVVDDRLRTSHPSIYAAGDVAEHAGQLYGLWQPSAFQGAIAGTNAAGGAADFAGLPLSNTLKVVGVDLFSIGRTEAGEGAVEFVVEDGPRYQRFLFENGFLAGAILFGDVSLGMGVKKAIEEKRNYTSVLGSVRGEEVPGLFR